MKLSKQSEPQTLQLIEECFFLLRTHGLETLPLFFSGSLPFYMLFLYFWAEMSRSALAQQNLASWCWGLCGAYVWMKLCHARFSRKLMHCLSGQSQEQKPASVFKTVVQQTTLQAWAPILLPLSMILTLPFAWVFVFFQNISVLGNGQYSSLREVYRKSWRDALLWPRSNHSALFIFSVFGLLVFISWTSFFLYLPMILKSMLGFEALLQMSVWTFFNTTFFTVMSVLTWLTLDPLLKAYCVLRCYYCQSLHTGEDLLRFIPKTPPVKVLTMGLLAMLCFQGTMSPTTLSASETRSVTARELDGAIQETATQPEYTWRLPRELPLASDQDPGWITQFIRGFFDGLKQIWEKTVPYVRDFFDWFFEKLFRPLDEDPISMGKSETWMQWVKGLTWVLLFICLCLLVLFVYRSIKNRRDNLQLMGSAQQSGILDLEDESLTADAQPPKDWLTLAKRLLQEGDVRLALRSLFLAILALLGERQFVLIQKYKSNLDYATELERLYPGEQELIQLFQENSSLFEKSWYGFHEATNDIYQKLYKNSERIREIVT